MTKVLWTFKAVQTDEWVIIKISQQPKNALKTKSMKRINLSFEIISKNLFVIFFDMKIFIVNF